ncbi:CHAD domain-containing protein [Alloalcanivorax mobilis]|uniref:CHAD domain-containing protein n=1 Tax=Alloalcanivorax mobilis TaxID=2019569 RepID=UPI000B5B348C|nr:CHAD domain-containing protein [Alloalcanivorax mobilis]ASK36275.1 hypothetical protein CEK62_18760 [Alcanivorax sp. N3-2A]
MSKSPVIESQRLPRLLDAARACNETALAQLRVSGRLSPGQVHDTRVASKKLRALWRLMATLGHDKNAARRDKALKRAAAALSPSRDAQVAGDTLERLAAASHRQFEQQALRQIAQQLRENGPASTMPDKPADLEGVFETGLTLWSELNVDATGAEVGEALARQYALGRRLLEQARERDDEQSWHRFRKGTKFLLYQLEALDEPELDTLPLRGLRKLGKRLGDMHDLHMVNGLLRRHARQAEEREPFVIARQVVSRHEARLREDVEQRARRLFALKPKIFLRHLNA